MLTIECSRVKSGVALRDIRVDQCFVLQGQHWRKTGKDEMSNGNLKCYCFEGNIMKYHPQGTRVKPCKLKLTHVEDGSWEERPQTHTIPAQELCPGDHFRTLHGSVIYVRMSDYAREKCSEHSGDIVGMALHNGNIKSFNFTHDIVPVQRGETHASA